MSFLKLINGKVMERLTFSSDWLFKKKEKKKRIQRFSRVTNCFVCPVKYLLSSTDTLED